MSRKSPLGAPLWSLIYGLVIVAFSFVLPAKSRNSYFSYLYGGGLGYDYTLDIFQCKSRSNTEMRRSIHKHALESKLLGAIGHAEMEKEIQKNCKAS
jgi:hypothetical protein